MIDNKALQVEIERLQQENSGYRARLAEFERHDTTPPEPQLVRHGFEIVDKRSGKEVYLDGSWAEMFQQQIQAWQREAPTQEEVEDILDRYTGLAQNPVVVH